MSQVFTKALKSLPSKMRCLQIEKYGKCVNELVCSHTTPCPSHRQLKADQALVRIHAASINPFDIEMSRGYGKNMIDAVKYYSKDYSKDLPLILGRDFSGTIIKNGRLFKRYKEGQDVYGVRWIVGQGTHAEYVIVDKNEISPKPLNLSHTEATSFPYVACTTWSALISSGAVPIKGSKKLNIFIPGGTGGIGSFAVQLCKVYGHNVFTSCSTNGIELLRNHLSIDNVLDYTQESYKDDLNHAGPFDVILDTQNEKHLQLYKSVLKKSSQSKYVSLRPTLLPDTDKQGLAIGVLNAGGKYVKSTLEQFSTGRGIYQWGFFSPNGIVLDHIRPLVEKGLIKPLIDKVFNIDDAIEAYKYVEGGHARGKTVIKMS